MTATTKPTGGPAFPTTYGDEKGLTARDYFAAEAMHGLIRQMPMQTNGTITAAAIAKGAYFIADAMIAERAK